MEVSHSSIADRGRFDRRSDHRWRKASVGIAPAGATPLRSFRVRPARTRVEVNFQGGSWTRDQYGGARDGTGVCLDTRGWYGSCFSYSACRRTDSNSLIISNAPVFGASMP